MEDNEILELFFARSEQAIAELAAKYGGACRKIAENILKDALDAEECVNDAYLGVWNTVPPKRPECLPGYLFRIVRNLAVKRYRSNTAQKRNSYYDASLDEIADCFPSSSSVEEEIEANELAAVIDGFLATLEKDVRVLFIRRYCFSDPIEDLAKLFGTSKHNISVRLSRLRKRLKKHLDKEGISL